MSIGEASGYNPEIDLNQALSDQRRREVLDSIRYGYDDIPLAFDENGDMVQPDRPMPEDELDRMRREAEGR